MHNNYEWVLISHRGIHASFGDLLLSPDVELHISTGLMAKFGPLWLHIIVPGLIKKLQADLFWATLAMLPWKFQSRVNIPSIINFHDLNAWVAPKTMKLWNRWQHKIWNQNSANQADAIICLSQTTKDDLLKYLQGINQDKIYVVYPGFENSNNVASQIPSGDIGKLDSFFLCVSTIEPRKNQITLLKAWLKLKKPEGFPALLFVGRKGWGDTGLYTSLHNKQWQKDRVFFLENASDAQLKWCYEKCLMIAMASLHEGFGLPVLEAASYQKPALLSDIPIFREIGPSSMFAAATDICAWSNLFKKSYALSKKNALLSPDFDAKLWSHNTRARAISKIIEKLI